MRKLTLLLAVLPALVGCDKLLGSPTSEQPGGQLGTFHVTGTRASNTCGEGALGATPTWEFNIDLAHEEGTIYWGTGTGYAAGVLAADEVSFSVVSTSVVDMRTEETLAYPPCSIERRDTATGTLDEAVGDEPVPGFTGRMTYQFAPTADSECIDLVAGEAPLFATLPCSMAYALEGVRIAGPEQEP
ncbi:hypothetical protein [Chondromyces apiculatus]|uniref:Lipoprotein n=1 Tax=Chondromyces apiculatus DSM 436 TaxID=1192034 RepID=A0A017TEB9_9BACT|nr:hypothetical protein [Chondromyces apiculatus]EYF07559.1 Hypothetical protein CAP_8682 [Chondromyces apiculatus DSM 436]